MGKAAHGGWDKNFTGGNRENRDDRVRGDGEGGGA
jgi:hypothetical protein